MTEEKKKNHNNNGLLEFFPGNEEWHDLSCLNIMTHKGSCCDDILCKLLKVVYMYAGVCVNTFYVQFNVLLLTCSGNCSRHTSEGWLTAYSKGFYLY